MMPPRELIKKWESEAEAHRRNEAAGSSFSGAAYRVLSRCVLELEHSLQDNPPTPSPDSAEPSEERPPVDLEDAVTMSCHELGNVLVPLDVRIPKSVAEADRGFFQQAMHRLWDVKRLLQQGLKIQKELKQDPYARLHDMLSDMIEGGRLRRGDIPDDYEALVGELEKLSGRPIKAQDEDPEDDGYLDAVVQETESEIQREANELLSDLDEAHRLDIERDGLL